jgi:hypothetical protein
MVRIHYWFPQMTFTTAQVYNRRNLKDVLEKDLEAAMA